MGPGWNGGETDVIAKLQGNVIMKRFLSEPAMNVQLDQFKLADCSIELTVYKRY